MAHEADVHLVVCAFVQKVNLPGPAFLSCGRERVSRRNLRTHAPRLPGVPSRMTLPEMLCVCIAALTASATPTPAMAMRLCPHACPIPANLLVSTCYNEGVYEPGKASISELTPTTRPPLPCDHSARHAVSKSR